MKPITILIVALAIPAWAQEPSSAADSGELDLFTLDQQVREMVPLSIAKSETSAEEAPAIVEVITRAQIREWGYQSVTEVLQHIPGFYVIDDHINPNVSVRGVSAGLFGDSSIIKVMVDGHSVAYR